MRFIGGAAKFAIERPDDDGRASSGALPTAHPPASAAPSIQPVPFRNCLRSKSPLFISHRFHSNIKPHFARSGPRRIVGTVGLNSVRSSASRFMTTVTDFSLIGKSTRPFERPPFATPPYSHVKLPASRESP